MSHSRLVTGLSDFVKSVRQHDFAYDWLVNRLRPMTNPTERKRLTVDLTGILELIDDLRNSLEWSELSSGSRIRVLLLEAIALNAEPRLLLEHIKTKLEAGKTEEAIALIDGVLERMKLSPSED